MEVQSAEARSTLTVTPRPTRGRPGKADAKTPAARAKAYRERLKADGFKEVKCYLDAEHLAYLQGLCDIYGVTIAEAVTLALSAVIRGELPAQPPAGESLPQPSVILLP